MKADAQLMRAAASRLGSLADEFFDDIDALRREAETVMSEDWTGQASGSHSTLWLEWVESAHAAVGALSSDAALLHAAADRYDTTEGASAHRVSSLHMD